VLVAFCFLFNTPNGTVTSVEKLTWNFASEVEVNSFRVCEGTCHREYSVLSDLDICIS